MKRREFIALLGSAAAVWPVVVTAQNLDRKPRIGVLMGWGSDTPQAKLNIPAFLQELQKLGWADSTNVQIDLRWAAGDADKIKTYAAQLVRLDPNVIVALSTPETLALKRETRTIPIVFVAAADPVGSGLVDSLARPGGNITGFTNYEAPMAAKWLELLKEMVPSLTRTAIILDPTNPSQAGFRATIRAAAVSLNVELTEIADHDPTEIERAVGAFAASPDGGLLVFPGTYTTVNREVILAVATRHRLPAIYPFRIFTETGGLLSYGVDSIELFRQGASYVNRILRGEKPADLPIQGPTKFELVINLKTAKALGLAVPPSLLARADEVIE